MNKKVRPMKFKYTPWMGACCYRYDNQWNGFGAQSRTDPKYAPMTCEKCGKLDTRGFLIRYRVPVKDIRFKFISSYDNHTSFRVLVDGKELPHRLEHQYDSKRPFDPTRYNYRNAEDYQRQVLDFDDTIRWFAGGGEQISDDIFAAFLTFSQKPNTRRAMWVETAEPAFGYETYGRAYYY